MSTHGSPGDEFGTGSTTVALRILEDVADDFGAFWYMKAGIGTGVKRTLVRQFKPLYQRANSGMVWDTPSASSIRYEGQDGDTMYGCYPLKRGKILSFSDSGGGTTYVNTDGDHFLNVSDQTRIIECQVGEYNGLRPVISTPTSDSYEIDVPYNGADSECEYKQERIFISVIADSATEPGVKTTLTMIDHGLFENIDITVLFTGQFGAGRTFNITNVTADTVDIPTPPGPPFTTGLADTGIRGVVFLNGGFFNFPPFRQVTGLDIYPSQGMSAGLFFQGPNFVDFIKSDIFGFNGGVTITINSRMINCTNWRLADNGFLKVTDINSVAAGPPASQTDQFYPCFRIMPNPNDNMLTAQWNRSSPANFKQYQSFIEIPQQVPAAARYSIINHTDPTPGTLVSLGWVNKANNTAITDEGGGTIKIYTDDTTRFREGHIIEVLQSANYTGQTGTIQVGGIDIGVSITVNIPYVAGDTLILMRDNSLASKDQSDVQVTGLQNVSLEDSTVTINAFLPFDAALTVPIITANVPVAIGGTWSATEEERVEFNTVGGITTYTGVEPRKLYVHFGATVDGAASSHFALHVYHNGTDITDDPPTIDIINAGNSSSNNGVQIVDVVTGDTFQEFISNTANASDPTVRQAHVNLTKVS